MSKKFIFIILIAIVLTTVAFLWKKQKEALMVLKSEESSITPSPVMIKPIVTDINANVKKVSFPKYKINFQIPSDLIQKDSLSMWERQKLDNTVTFRSFDYKAGNPGEEPINGVFGAVTVDTAWIGFPDESPQNKPIRQEMLAKIDNSLLPKNNPLINTNTTRAYDSDEVSVKLDTQALLGEVEGMHISCKDVSSNRCPQIIQSILSSLKIE